MEQMTIIQNPSVVYIMIDMTKTALEWYAKVACNANKKVYGLT